MFYSDADEVRWRYVWVHTPVVLSAARQALYRASLDGFYGAAGASYSAVDLTSSYKAVSTAYADDSGAYAAPLTAPPAGTAAVTTTTATTTATETVLTDIIAKFYWNEKFQLLLERMPATPDEAKRRAAQIDALMGRFAAIGSVAMCRACDGCSG